jgi:serine/threonine protein kinase
MLAGGSTGNIPTIAVGTPTTSPASRRTTGALSMGALLGGRYRIVETVGKGGFGAVYKATDERFKSRRTVAIKEMSDAHLNPAERLRALEDFRQEADLLVQLRHPNLPDVSDFFEEGGKAYLVMEFVAGKTLEKLQDEASGPLAEGLVLGWALQLCDVLQYLHTQPQPIIFRDLKPSNVMVTATGQVKLIDFGIARIFKTTSAKDTMTLGSRGYAPLEQYGSGQSDPRSDIYALGATLYDLLTHQVPLDAPVRRINPSAFIQPHALNAHISPQTERIILKAMADMPGDRYQSAAEMFQAIAGSGLAGSPPVSYTTAMAGQPAAGGIPSTIPALPFTSTQPVATGMNTTPAIPQTIAAMPPSSPMQPPLVLPSTSTQSTVAGAASQTIAVQQAQTFSQQRPVQPPIVVGGAPTFVAPGQMPPIQQASVPPLAPPASPVPSGGTGGPNAPQGRGITRRAALIGGLGVAGALLAGGWLISRVGSGGGNLPTTSGSIQLPFAYSTEKAAWLHAAIQAFNNSPTSILTLGGTNKSIVPVLLDNSGSLDIADKILSGAVKPVIWSPANAIELGRLNYKWMNAHNGQEIIPSSTDLAPQALVRSPFVLAMWKSRAAAFRTKMQIDWEPLHSALQGRGWADFGHPEWGSITLGQTYPTLSNSGLLSVMLMTYAYDHKTNGPQHLNTTYINNNPGLWSYIEAFEQAVSTFGGSSGSYFLDTIIPQGYNHSVVLTYENLALSYQQQAQASVGEPLQIFYPSQNIVSEHPFAILDAPWVSDEEKSAAIQLRNFLRGHNQQLQALSYGFRPSDSSISLTNSRGAANPFNQLASLAPASRFDTRISPQVPTPGGDVVDALITQWKNHNPGV